MSATSKSNKEQSGIEVRIGRKREKICKQNNRFHKGLKYSIYIQIFAPVHVIFYIYSSRANKPNSIKTNFLFPSETVPLLFWNIHISYVQLPKACCIVKQRGSNNSSTIFAFSTLNQSNTGIEKFSSIKVSKGLTQYTTMEPFGTLQYRFKKTRCGSK